jgi:hypothetical protein
LRREWRIGLGEGARARGCLLRTALAQSHYLKYLVMITTFPFSE